MGFFEKIFDNVDFEGVFFFVFGGEVVREGVGNSSFYL